MLKTAIDIHARMSHNGESSSLSRGGLAGYERQWLQAWKVLSCQVPLTLFHSILAKAFGISTFAFLSPHKKRFTHNLRSNLTRLRGLVQLHFGGTKTFL